MNKKKIKKTKATKKASKKIISSNIFYAKKITKKAEAIKKILKITSNDFYSDKLYFLLGLKPVLRIEIIKNQTFKEAIKGFEKYHNATYKNYIFVSKSKSKAELAKNLTKIDYKKLDSDTNRKYNFFLGKLYGYPKCCSLSFPDTNPRDNFKKERELFLSTRFIHKEKELYLSYIMCSKDCKETIKLKNKIKTEIDKLNLL